MQCVWNTDINIRHFVLDIFITLSHTIMAKFLSFVLVSKFSFFLNEIFQFFLYSSAFVSVLRSVTVEATDQSSISSLNYFLLQPVSVTVPIQQFKHLTWQILLIFSILSNRMQHTTQFCKLNRQTSLHTWETQPIKHCCTATVQLSSRVSNQLRQQTKQLNVVDRRLLEISLNDFDKFRILSQVAKALLT